jgi:hypothetical protein
MAQQQRSPLSTFVIRFWQEADADASRWHGHARHIQSGEQVSFADEATLTGFIRRWVTMLGDKGDRQREGT